MALMIDNYEILQSWLHERARVSSSCNLICTFQNSTIMKIGFHKHCPLRMYYRSYPTWQHVVQNCIYTGTILRNTMSVIHSPFYLILCNRNPINKYLFPFGSCISLHLLILFSSLKPLLLVFDQDNRSIFFFFFFYIFCV